MLNEGSYTHTFDVTGAWGDSLCGHIRCAIVVHRNMGVDWMAAATSFRKRTAGGHMEHERQNERTEKHDKQNTTTTNTNKPPTIHYQAIPTETKTAKYIPRTTNNKGTTTDKPKHQRTHSNPQQPMQTTAPRKHPPENG